MTLKERLNEDLRAALRSADEVRKVTIRGALAAIRNAEIAAGRDFDDADVLRVLQPDAKQRRDSSEEFKKGKRQALVDKESAEIDVIQAYLPQQMGREEIAGEARAVIAET